MVREPLRRRQPLNSVYKKVQYDVTDGTFVILLCCIIDIAELNLPKTCKTDFPNPDDLLNFKIIIMPDEVNILL